MRLVSAVLEIRGVEKRYRSVQALAGIDLTIDAGEIFGLLGPNGAGKSTLIHVVGGLTRADRGGVSVLGHDVVTDYRQARRNIGIVPQELVFDAFLRVRETLRLQAGYFGLGRSQDAWIDELITILGLSDKAEANMRTLSGGMKRRVLVAQALVHRPPVIVLDEPTAGGDVEMRRSLWALVSRLRNEGHTIVLTTHYLEEAQKLCDRIGILNRGKLLALDRTEAFAAQGLETVYLRVTESA